MAKGHLAGVLIGLGIGRIGEVAGHPHDIVGGHLRFLQNPPNVMPDQGQLPIERGRRPAVVGQAHGAANEQPPRRRGHLHGMNVIGGRRINLVSGIDRSDMHGGLLFLWASFSGQVVTTPLRGRNDADRRRPR